MADNFKTVPFAHQLACYEKTKDLAAYALLWEQGTAKTKPVIDTGCHLFTLGKINAVLVVAPNGVDENWVKDQIPEHCWEDVLKVSRLQLYRPEKRTTKWHEKEMRQSIYHEGLLWLCVPYDTFISKGGKKYIWEVLRRRKCLYVCDEASDIKTPGAKRSMSIIASSKYADYKRILEGTPITKDPFDIYNQIRFIDHEFWVRELGIDTFMAFKVLFGMWVKRGNEESPFDLGTCVAYRNIDLLRSLLAKTGSRVLKKDVLDLPERLYNKRYHELNSEQKRVYKELKDDMMSAVNGQQITVGLPIVQLLRLQQVVCGYIPVDSLDDEPQPVELLGKTNPRLELAEHCTSIYHRQGIIWARFHKDIDLLADMLGNRAVVYDGRVPNEERQRNKEAFQRGDVQWILANQQAMARGHTLNEAKLMMFYSNSYRARDRLQAEDRNHRAGQDESVEVIDLIASGTVDTKIVSNLRKKVDVASQVLGDDPREWI